ncbi:MAG: Serine/threonine exchanger SteT [Syntrophorhabdus sp. PtaU1.Bin002]|nr:MAG: Serine/threonine exchanger SteT [Syntrophorhabdus sp. PtaB.Bin006]OPY70977.1 MAG: Serine/threonine exchanger SteT [Syntrophorhabdus sp. PtaU1.Bin002]
MSFKRKLNLFDATMLVVGNVVGAGIFTTAGFLAGELNNPWFFAGIWIIGGLLTLCGALTYAEMTSMFPRSGGDYLYLKAAYGPWAGFLLGWICFWIINPGSIAVLSIGLVKYLTGFLGHPGVLGEKLMAVVVVLLFSTVNYRGVRLTGTSQNFWTMGSLAILLFFIIGGLVSGKGNWGHFAGGETGLPPMSKLLGPAMIAVIFSYSGWFVTAYIGDEVKRPERNLPLSLTLGTIIVIVLYVAINAVYLYAIPIESLKGVVNVGQVAGERLMSSGFVQAVTIAIIFAIAASINATVLAGARLSYAIAKDGFFLSCFEKLHTQHGTPHVALLIQAGLACLYIAVDTFESLLSAVVFIMLLSSIGSGMAHLILRRRKPLLERPYRTRGYPFVPVLFIVAYSYIAVQIFLSSPARSVLGVAITVSGVPFYLYAIYRGNENATKGVLLPHLLDRRSSDEER